MSVKELCFKKKAQFQREEAKKEEVSICEVNIKSKTTLTRYTFNLI